MTGWRVIPALSASSSWVNPFLVRKVYTAFVIYSAIAFLLPLQHIAAARICQRHFTDSFYASLLPISTESLFGSMSTHPSPALFLKPSVSTSDVNGPICLGGKFTTQQTKEFNNSSLVCAPTACTLERLIPTSGPKSISNLYAGFRASG